MIPFLSRNVLRFQWAQLIALTIAHFFIDMYAGMVPAILPAINSGFSLQLSQGLIVLGCLNLAANGVQIFTGHMRAEEKKPLLLPIGLMVACALCFMGLLPRVGLMFYVLMVLALISGAGIAMTHVEGLRAVYVLRRISPSFATSVFLMGGFFGFSGGGWIASMLVDSPMGLKGLLFLTLGPVIGIALLWLCRVRLAVERATVYTKASDRVKTQVPFWVVFAVTLPATFATTFIFSLLATRLSELGFKLSFGGFSVMILGLGMSLGSMGWGYLAHRLHEMKTALIALCSGLGFFVLYFALIDHGWAVCLLAGAGATGPAFFPVMVALARRAKGLRLGQRMAFMLGGQWGLASVVMMALSKPIELVGTGLVLWICPIGYVLSAAMMALWLGRKRLGLGKLWRKLLPKKKPVDTRADLLPPRPKKEEKPEEPLEAGEGEPEALTETEDEAAGDSDKTEVS